MPCLNIDKVIDVCLDHSVLLLLLLTASSDITRICSTTFGGCCNKRIERGMTIQIKKDIKHLIHQSNQKVKREFDIAYDVFKGKNS